MVNSHQFSFEIPEHEDLRGSEHKKPEYIYRYWPEFYEMLQKQYPDSSLPAQLYMFYNDIKEHPRCCCGKLLEYRSPKLGFRKFCSIKCATNSKETQAKTKQTNKLRYGGTGFASKKLAQKHQLTMLNKYGVENAMHSEEIKERVKSTCVERYGTENAAANPEIMKKIRTTQEERYGGFGMASKELMEKIRTTQEERYGGFGLGAEHMKELSKKTMVERYGVEHASMSKEMQERAKRSRVNSIIKKYPIITDIFWQDGAKVYECKCPHPDSCNKCAGKFRIFNEQFYRRLQDGTELCTILLPYQHPHQSNTSVEVFVKMILDKYNVQYTQNDRNVIGPQEVDFYIPSKKIAIECNGIRWHSTEFKDKNYHSQKYATCNAAGIRLLTIWEDWIVNTPQIVESLLKSKLGIISTKIYARQCIIKEVPHKEAAEFLQANHIQGKCSSSITYGLYYKNALVCLMSFGKKRVAQGNKIPSWELIRFCNKNGMCVVGGASRLLAHFLKTQPVDKLISFSSNDISDGNLYKVLGFAKSTQNHSYWYVGRDFKRHHRFTFCKAKLVKNGADPNLSEQEIMRSLPYYCIYDSGQTKWVLDCEYFNKNK